MRPKHWICSREKSSKSLTKRFFEKKQFFQLICADMIFKTVCGIFFLNKWVLRYLSFGDFKVSKNGSSQQNY